MLILGPVLKFGGLTHLNSEPPRAQGIFPLPAPPVLPSSPRILSTNSNYFVGTVYPNSSNPERGFVCHTKICDQLSLIPFHLPQAFPPSNGSPIGQRSPHLPHRETLWDFPLALVTTVDVVLIANLPASILLVLLLIFIPQVASTLPCFCPQ